MRKNDIKGDFFLVGGGGTKVPPTERRKAGEGGERGQAGEGKGGEIRQQRCRTQDTAERKRGREPATEMPDTGHRGTEKPA